jgi:hypothetical protein
MRRSNQIELDALKMATAHFDNIVRQCEIEDENQMGDEEKLYAYRTTLIAIQTAASEAKKRCMEATAASAIGERILGNNVRNIGPETV